MKANDIIENYKVYLELKNHFKTIIAEDLLSEIIKPEDAVIIGNEEFLKGYYARNVQVEHIIKKYIEFTSL